MHTSRRSLLGLSVVTLFLAAGCTAAPGPSGSSASSSAAASSASSDIVVSQPAPSALVTSPLVVRGEARGPWYFEASFPVRLLDAAGNQIAMAPAQAQGDWMTTDFVPFEATLTFTTASATGTLVLEKDNPSGEPANAASVSIPVVF